jgi:hypothetical protein
MRQMITMKDKRCLIVGSADESDTSYEVVRFGAEGSDYRGQLGQLPFDAETFDKMIIFDTPLCFEQYLDEWFRVLKPVAGLVLNFPSPFITVESVCNWFNKNSNGTVIATHHNNYVVISRVA